MKSKIRKIRRDRHSTNNMIRDRWLGWFKYAYWIPINNTIQIESLNQHKNNDKAKILQLIEKAVYNLWHRQLFWKITSVWSVWILIKSLLMYKYKNMLKCLKTFLKVEQFAPWIQCPRFSPFILQLSWVNNMNKTSQMQTLNLKEY